MHAVRLAHGRVLVVAVVLAAVAAAGTLAAPESAQWGTSGDVMFYLGTAETLVRDGRFAVPIGAWERPQDSLTIPAHYPPGFALAVALPLRLGLSTDMSARLVRSAGAAMTVGLAVLLVGTIAGVWAAALTGVMILVSPAIVFTQTNDFSESLFIPFVIATVAGMALWPERPWRYGLSAAAGVGVRLIALSLTGAAVAWAAAQPGRLTQRVQRGLAALIPSVVVQGAWMAFIASHGGRDDRHFGYYGPFMQLARRFIGANARWFAPALPDGPLRVVAKCVMVSALVAVCVSGLRAGSDRSGSSSMPSDTVARRRRLLGALVWVVICYNAVYFGARLLLEWSNNLETRNFAAVDALYAVAFGTGLAVWWPSVQRRSRTVVATIAACWIVAAATESIALLQDAAQQTSRWRAEVATSPLLAWIRTRGGGREVYTNWSAVVWRADGRRTRMLPLLFDADTINALGAAMVRDDAVLVWWRGRLPLFSLRPERMSAYASPDRIAKTLGLPLLAQFDEGVVWGPPPMRAGAHAGGD